LALIYSRYRTLNDITLSTTPLIIVLGICGETRKTWVRFYVRLMPVELMLCWYAMR
jgi:hypothetical protein